MTQLWVLFQNSRCVSYLTVESEDPVTMTLSSYCRHNTEPVWPVSIFRHSRDCLSQIYRGERTGAGREERKTSEVEGDTQKRTQRKRKNKWLWKGCRFGSCQEWPILSAVFMPHFPTAALSTVCVRKSHSALPWVCVSLLQNNKKSNPLFSSLHPPLLFIIFSSPLLSSQARQISGKHIGLELSPFIL